MKNAPFDLENVDPYTSLTYTQVNKVPVRLNDNQAIVLARYFYCLVNTLESEDKTDAEKIQCLDLC